MAIASLVLRAALQSGWSIEPDELTYVPKGPASHHWRAVCRHRGTYFITVDDLDTKPWMGKDRSSALAGLTAAYETAWCLHHEDGLALAVPPVRTDAGSVAVQIDERRSMAVFPYVEGEAGEWGAPIGTDQREALLRELAGLHAAPRARHGPVARRRLELPERDPLADALASLDRAWTSGPYAEPARRVLADNTSGVHERLARFDELAAELHAPTRSSSSLTVSHIPGTSSRAPRGSA